MTGTHIKGGQSQETRVEASQSCKELARIVARLATLKEIEKNWRILIMTMWMLWPRKFKMLYFL